MIGKRIHVIGNSCSGKSTIAREISEQLQIPLVDIDAINWQPNWLGLNSVDPERLVLELKSATSTETWVVAGSYLPYSQIAFWHSLDTLIWLDLPRELLVTRMLFRSWKRWRSKELLWGTNYEKFWPQLMVWRKNKSLLWWIVTQHQKNRNQLQKLGIDPKWKHIDFIRVTSIAELDKLKQTIYQ